jgi:hypothetical protein
MTRSRVPDPFLSYQRDQRQRHVFPFTHRSRTNVLTIVGDPDPHVFWASRIDPLFRGSDPDPFLFLIKVLSGLKKCLQNKILTQNLSLKQ